MTEQHPSFGGVAVADPTTTMSPLDLGSDDAGTDNRRKLALVGAVVAVLVVLVAAFFMLKGKGNSDTAGGVVPHVVAPTTTGASGTAAAAPKPIKLPKAFHGVVGRDPFKALYVVPAPKPAAATTPTSPGTTPTAPGVTPVAPSGTGQVPTQTAPGSNKVAADLSAPMWIEFDSLSPQGPTFRIMYADNVAYVYQHIAIPKAGKTTVFASSFSLLSVHDGVAVVQLADGTPFRMKQGYDYRHFFAG